MGRRLVFLALLTLSLFAIASAAAVPRPALAVDEAGCRAAFDPSKTPGPATVFKRVACIAGFLNPATTNLIYDRTQVAIIIGELIQTVLSFLGIIFIIMIIYAGWMWGTAEGNEEKIDRAKGLIRDAVIGAILTFSAYALSYFILSSVIGPALSPSIF